MYICVKRMQLAVSYISIDHDDIEEAIDLDDFVFQTIDHDYEVSRELVNDIPDNPLKFLEEEEKEGTFTHA
jgi:hypothetical protein